MVEYPQLWKNLYIGHGMYKAGTNTPWRDKNELPYQIKREREEEIQEEVFILVAVVLKIILIIGMIVYSKIII